MRIPITMCHGVQRTAAGQKPFTAEHFDRLMKIACDMGFESINYNDLEAWRAGKQDLPSRPIMIDFDHPHITMRHEVLEVLEHYGFKGNLFVNLGWLVCPDRCAMRPAEGERMTWEDIRDLVDSGWHIGSHTVTHPNLSELSVEDPSGETIRGELEQCDEALTTNLGITSRDFAFTGTSWSSQAEREVMQRYRFGRLWIIGSEYQADGQPIRYADLVGISGPDAADGGPPAAARYITKESNPYRLPSMELQQLVYEPDAFRRYLEGAI